MKRIDPDSVAAFFAAHPDIRPIQGQFVRHGGPGRGVIGCCGSVAALMMNEGEGVDRYNLSTNEWYVLSTNKMFISWCMIKRILDLSAEYTYGFILGWEGGVHDVSLHDDGYDRGYEDGRMAYAATQQIRRVDP